MARINDHSDMIVAVDCGCKGLKQTKHFLIMKIILPSLIIQELKNNCQFIVKECRQSSG